jgi:sulfatase modifying factor 1
MSKKSAARRERRTAKAATAGTPTAAAPQAPATPPARRLPWKWLALLLLAAGVGYGLTIFLSGDGPPGPAPEGMVWVPRGKFSMGTDERHQHFFDAHPVHEVSVDGFWMDETEVTNAQFAKFVEATGYVTIAEQKPTKEQVVATLRDKTKVPAEEDLVPGALVFAPDPNLPQKPGPNRWAWVPGACWTHPEGPGSDIKDRMNHPVVHICWKDADAYCNWAGKRLPTEAEWERAARGGLDGKKYVWGDDPPGEGGKWRCNIWQGEFPWTNTLADGHLRTAPVKSYPPNAYGLYDMSGNVWEWCADWYHPDYYKTSPAENPKGPQSSYDPRVPETDDPYMPKRVQRGGSFLCNDGFCSRYKPYGRGEGDVDTGTSHIGFRCVKEK